MKKKNERGEKEQKCLDVARECLGCINDWPQELFAVINLIMNVIENPQNNDFPDFIGENGFIEHFEVTSSKTTNSGSKMKREEAYFRNSDLQHIVYSKHSHEGFIESFKKIWQNHIDSLNDKKIKANVGIFMVEYKDASMIVDIQKSQLYNRNQFIYPQDVIYTISKDKDLLNYIYDFRDKIQYVVFVNEDWRFKINFCELIDVNNIPKMVSEMCDVYVFSCNQIEGGKFTPVDI